MLGIDTIFISFLIMLGLLFLSLPIGVVMMVVGVIGGYLVFGSAFMSSIGNMLWGALNNDVLTCVPLFIFMGELLLRSGIADGMYSALNNWLGGLPGGLVHTNIVSCALFSATTGSSVACAATVGTVALPTLTKHRYPLNISLGSLAAGGTLGILIPPSIALLVYGGLTNNSIGKLFIGGVIPGVLLTSLFMLYIGASSYLFKTDPSKLPCTWRDRLRTLPALVPPLIIFLVVMGSIYTGIATPTESASLGVLAALCIVCGKGKLSLELVRNCFVSTAQLTGMIMLIVTCALILNLTLSLAGVPQMMTSWVGAMNLSQTQLLFALIGFYFVLGCFLDVLSIQVATIPISYPMAMAAGCDPIWYGVFIVLMSELAMITPPVGMNLFIIQSIRTDGGTLSDAIRGALPFAGIMFLCVLLLMVFPELVTFLPNNMN